MICHNFGDEISAILRQDLPCHGRDCSVTAAAVALTSRVSAEIAEGQIASVLLSFGIAGCTTGGLIQKTNG